MPSRRLTITWSIAAARPGQRHGRVLELVLGAIRLREE